MAKTPTPMAALEFGLFLCPDMETPKLQSSNLLQTLIIIIIITIITIIIIIITIIFSCITSILLTIISITLICFALCLPSFRVQLRLGGGGGWGGQGQTLYKPPDPDGTQLPASFRFLFHVRI